MAASSSIPKRMSVIPEVLQVNKFVGDMALVSKSVNTATRNINRSLKSITSASVALPRATNNVRGFGNAISRNLSGLNRWAASFDASNNALTSFGQTLTRVGFGISRFSFQLERFGRGLLLGITLPFVAASVVAINAGKDFESALVKVETLVGVNRKVVKAWGQEIMDVSADLATLPVEMAKGLFSAASGFGSLAAQKPVMDVLTSSTRAAAVGLGEIEDIARAATSMMNAFGEENLSASKAVSLLVLGVREGNLEVDKLSTALGNVLGVGAFIGASADDVIAFVSAYTRFGVEPTRAVTALNTAFTNLIKPSNKNREILEAYGLTLDTIREKIGGPGGLAGLLVSMQENMDEEQFLSIFGLRALKAVAAVTNSVSGFNAEYLRVSDTMKAETGETFKFLAFMAEKGSQLQKRYLKESIDAGETGMNALETAFIRHMDTIQYKFDQVKSNLQKLAIGISGAMEPTLKGILDKVNEILESMNKFVKENQQTVIFVVKLAGAFALLGPALLIVAKLGQGFGLAMTAIGAFINTLGRVVGFLANFVFHAIRLSVVVGVKIVGAFITLGVAIGTAVFAMSVFILRLGAVMAFELALWLMHVSTAFLGLGLAIASSAIGALVPFFMGIAGAVISVVSAVGALGVALTAVGALGLAAIGGLATLWDTITGIGESIASSFNEITGSASSWGEGLMAAYSEGIIDGFVYVINSITAIANWITSQFSTSSPPKILPNITNWGKQTMQAWIDGWAKADFSVFKDIMSTVEGYLKAVLGASGDEDDEGIIPRILLGSRELIAAAINEINKLGTVSKNTLNKIYDAIGSTTLELRAYIDATFNAAAATKKLADAQQKINDINERYAKILEPIQKKLKEIEDQRNVASDSRELEQLERLLQRRDLPSQIEDLANLRVEEIGLEGDVQRVEGQRDVELSAAEKQLDAAVIANDLAQAQLDFAKGALDLQMDSLGLMEQLNENVKKLKDPIEKVKKGLDAILGELKDPTAELPEGGGINIPSGDDGEDVLGAYDEKLQELKDAAENLRKAWGEAFSAMGLSISSWWTGVKEKWANFKEGFVNKWGPTLIALEVEGRRTWDNIAGIFSKFWTDTEESRTDIFGWFKDFGDYLAEELPGKITTFSDILNNVLIPRLAGLAGVIHDGFDDIFNPPEDDPILNWMSGIGEGQTFQAWGEGLGVDFDKALESFRARHRASWALFKMDISSAMEDTVVWAQGIADIVSNALKIIDDVIQSIPLFSDEQQESIDMLTGGFDIKDSAVQEFDLWGWAVDGLSNIAQGIIDVREEALSTNKKLHGEIDDAGNAAEDIAPKFDIYSNSMEGVTKSTGHLGTSFSTAGLSINTARVYAQRLMTSLTLLKLNAIILKDQAIATLTTKIEELKDIKEEWREEISKVMTWISNLVTDINGAFIEALEGLYSYLFESINPVFTIFNELLAAALGWIKDKLDKAIESLNRTLGNLKEKLDPILEPLREFVDLLERMVKAVAGLSKRLIDWILGGGNPDDFTEPDDDEEGSAKGTDQSTSSTGGSSPSIAGIVSDIIKIANSPFTGTTTTAGPAPSIASANNGFSGIAGVSIVFGDIIINNDMDMETFEARVRNAVSESISG